MVAKAKDKAKELQNLVEELKANIFEDTCLDHLQKRNDELSTLLNKAKEDAVVEFRASKQFTDLLDANYAAGFENFRMDAIENFLEVDFSSIKLNLGAATSTLLQTSSENINVWHRDPRPIQALGPVPYRPWAQAHTGPEPSPIPALGTGPAERSSYPAPFLKLP